MKNGETQTNTNLPVNKKLEHRKSELEKMHAKNMHCLEKEAKCHNVKNVQNLKLGRFTYDNDEDNKSKKDVRNRTILLYVKRLFFIFIAAIIFNFGVVAFLNRGDTIPSGLSGFPMLAVLISKNKGYPQVENYFALMFLAVNVPLFLTFGLKEKKSFVLLTLAFMLFQIVVNLFFTLIPEVKKFIANNINIAPGWHKQIHIFDKNGVKIGEYENSISWPLLVNGFLGSLCAAAAIAIAWKNAGSTGGTDIVAYYYSTKKQKSVASVIFVINMAATCLFLVIFAFAAPHKKSFDLGLLSEALINKTETNTSDLGILNIQLNVNVDALPASFYNSVAPRTIIGLREVSSFLYIVINNIVLNIIYPKYKKVSLEISCKNPDNVIKYFKDVKYWHGYTILKAKSGFTGADIYVISTTLLLLETKSIISDLKSIDPSIWIAIKPVDGILGSFNTKYVEV
ncbi:YitT family protein [Mycoplasmopsis felifaucium]|uniref:YitT family protein n=1 Tax=Mycoplasmopsis felifaucium TaxID=35768 RepID=A0ABZ2RSN2_9BACT